VLSVTDVSNYVSAQGQGIHEDFGRTNQNLEVRSTIAVAGQSSLLENVFCSDPTKCTPSEAEVHIHKKIIPSSSKSCDVEQSLESNAVCDNVDDHGIGIVERNTLPSPSGSLDDNIDELSFGDAGERGSQHYVGKYDNIHRPSFTPTPDEECILHFLDEEQLDYRPSPVQKKKDDKEEDDVYSISDLSLPHMVFHEVRETPFDCSASILCGLSTIPRALLVFYYVSIYIWFSRLTE
jgi:hypothetical protein